MPEKGLWPADPRDRLRIREAEATGTPFLVLRDDAGAQRIVALAGDREAAAVIGRSPESDVPIEWDDRVSRTHAQLARVGRRWYVEDEGLSRNGTFVNEQRVHGRSGLRDGDVIRVGHTTIVFRTPPAAEGASRATAPSRASPSRRRCPPGSAARSRRSAVRAWPPAAPTRPRATSRSPPSCT